MGQLTTTKLPVIILRRLPGETPIAHQKTIRRRSSRLTAVVWDAMGQPGTLCTVDHNHDDMGTGSKTTVTSTCHYAPPTTHTGQTSERRDRHLATIHTDILPVL